MMEPEQTYDGAEVDRHLLQPLRRLPYLRACLRPLYLRLRHDYALFLIVETPRFVYIPCGY